MIRRNILPERMSEEVVPMPLVKATSPSGGSD
jgi:hypothetical protein